jgi:hypothetical protein
MMWNPPIALTSEERKIAARTRKTRKFFVFLREHRHEILDADFQHLLAQRSRQEPGGQEPVDAGLLALATLLQAYCHVGDRDAVELTVMDKRWQLVLDCLGAEQPPFSQGTLFNFRMRLIAHDLDKALLDRTVALAEKTGGVGARQLRAVLDSTPLVGAGRVEDTLNLLGHALRKAVGLAAQALGTSTVALREAAGLMLVGHSSLKAALDLDWGEPSARARALGLVLEEVARWHHWLEQQHTLAVQAPPIKEVMETITQMITQDTEPDPEGGCEFYHLMRLDKQTCDWHNKKCDSLYVTQDISKEACQAAGNAVALIRVKINPVATNNVASRIFQCEKWL